MEEMREIIAHRSPIGRPNVGPLLPVVPEARSCLRLRHVLYIRNTEQAVTNAHDHSHIPPISDRLRPGSRACFPEACLPAQAASLMPALDYGQVLLLHKLGFCSYPLRKAGTLGVPCPASKYSQAMMR
jgi:hypothetical protein